MTGTRIILHATVAIGMLWSFAVQAEDIPKRRAGIWVTSTGSRVQTKDGTVGARRVVKQCIDDKTDSLAQSAAKHMGPCEQVRSVKTARGYEIEASSCGQSKVILKGLISGDFSSRVTAHVKSTEILASGEPPETVTVWTDIESTYIGPCTADLRPGDEIAWDGTIIRRDAR